MNEKSIQVVCLPDGTVEIKPVGFSGPACEKATKAIEEALGIVSGKKRTPDYYRVQQSERRQAQR